MSNNFSDYLHQTTESIEFILIHIRDAMKHTAYEKHAIASITCLRRQHYLNQMNYWLEILYISILQRGDNNFCCYAIFNGSLASNKQINVQI